MCADPNGAFQGDCSYHSSGLESQSNVCSVHTLALHAVLLSMDSRVMVDRPMSIVRARHHTCLLNRPPSLVQVQMSPAHRMPCVHWLLTWQRDRAAQGQKQRKLGTRLWRRLLLRPWRKSGSQPVETSWHRSGSACPRSCNRPNLAYSYSSMLPRIETETSDSEPWRPPRRQPWRANQTSTLL